jgi:hypothetical protein
MRVALRVSSSYEYWDGGCEFVLVEVTPELAALALRRIAALRAQKPVDPDIDEAYYWTSCVECYFSPLCARSHKGDYVVPVVMWRPAQKADVCWEGIDRPPHNLRVQRARKKAIKLASSLHGLLGFAPPISQWARALAFVSRSTSA